MSPSMSVRSASANARAMARKPAGRDPATLAANCSTRSDEADAENIDGSIAATNSPGGRPDTRSLKRRRSSAPA